MSKIIIGTAGGKNIGFEVALLLATRLLITADSGGGKSWLARVLFEQAFGKIQIIIIDPEGEFSSLRENFPFVLAGKGGDTPIDLRSAGMLAHRLLKLRVSAVCDLYEMKAHERHIWVRDFFNALIEAPKELRVPLLLGVDEFHVFAPEKGQGESEAKQASIDIATRGRKRGICLAGITQRLAMLDKNITSQLQNRLIGPTFEEVNIKTAVRLLGIAPGAQERQFHQQIQLLEPGHFFAFGRAISRERILVKVREVHTTHPKAFEKHSVPLPPTPEKIKGLLPQLADLPKEAEDKARTEAEFKREIRDLKQKLQQAEKNVGRTLLSAAPAKADPQKLQQKIERQVAAAIKQRDASWMHCVRDFQREMERRASEGTKQLSGQLHTIPFVVPEEVKLAPAPTAASKPQPEPRVPHPSRLSKGGDFDAEGEVRLAAGRAFANKLDREIIDDGRFAAAHIKILSGLDEILAATGKSSVRKEQLAAWTEYSPTSGGFANNLGSLRTAGAIDYPQPGYVTITEEGRKHSRATETPVSTAEMLAHAKRVLGGSEARLLDALHGRYPEAMSKEELAQLTGFSATSGGYANNLGHMRTLGFIDYPEKGIVRASDWLFIDQKNGEAA